MSSRPSGPVLLWAVLTVLGTAGLVVARDLLDVPLWATVAGAVAVAGVVLAAAALGVDGLAVLLLVLAVGTSTWNAVAAGPVKPGPVLLAASVVLLLVLQAGAPERVRVPSWVWVLGGTILLVTVAAALFPPSIPYLAARFVSDHTYSLDQLGTAWVLNLLEGAQWLVAAVALPVAVCVAARYRAGLLVVLVEAWIVGTAVNAGVGVADESAGTGISRALIGTVDIGGRQAGLTVQPNHLAVAVAMTLPVALWLALRGSRPVLMGACAMVAAVGLATTESRGGLAAAALACGGVLFADRRARSALPVLGVLGVAGAVLAVALFPDRLLRLAEGLRLVGAASARESNSIRVMILHQALADFTHAPVLGVGLEVVVQGHNIWLQLLASGGVVLLTGFLVACVGFALDARATRGGATDLSTALLVAVGTWLGVGVVENNLTDLFLYVPFAVVAAMRATTPPDTGPPADPVPVHLTTGELRP
ncbi:O-antigen ligase family protein [Pseudonocardia sp. ICBG1122]|nr:O-antigen ligase family protein [Pseudonocardia pini]